MDISIIIPIYHGDAYIPSLLESINRNMVRYREKYDSECELIFINDAPDEILNVSEDYNITGLDIHVINTDVNRGIHGARVFGLSKASGEYVMFLDQDDKISDEYLLQQRMKISGYDAVVCNAYILKTWSRTRRKLYADADDQSKVTRLDYYIHTGNAIFSPGQVLIRRDKIPQLWCENILSDNGADDYMLWMMMLSFKAKFGINDKCLFSHVQHGGNTSEDYIQMKSSESQVIDILTQNNILDAEQINIFKEHRERNFDTNIRYTKVITLFEQWFHLKQHGGNVCDNLRYRNLHKIAIYGMGNVGNCLYEELIGTSIDIVFAIDKTAVRIECEVPVCVPESPEFYQWVQNVDAIVVTDVSAFREIKKELERTCSKPIISLSDVLTELVNEGASKVD